MSAHQRQASARDADATHDFSARQRFPMLERADRVAAEPTPLDRAFIALHRAYQAHGGLLRLVEVALAAAVRSPGRPPSVESLAAAGEVFGLEWQGAWWVPLFQLGRPWPTVLAGPRRIVAELGPTFEGWELANWFVQPNSWLQGRQPIDWLETRLPEVLEAARGDRFVATAWG